MKCVKINFTGFWPEMKKDDNFLINALRKYYNVELSDDPDFLFCSCFSDEALKYDCVKIFYTGENLVPDFNLYDYAISYENIVYDDRHLRFTDYAIEEEYGTDCDKMELKHVRASQIMNEKKDFCSFVVSKGSGYVDPVREELFHVLCGYKKVNSGGRFLNNIGEPNGVKDKLAFQKTHKFAIAAENSAHKGYRTEKIVQAFAAGCIPIYWGDPDIEEEFNGKAFINCGNYSSLEEVVERVKEVDSNDELYRKMLEEPALKDQSRISQYHNDLEKFLCHIIDQGPDKAFRRDRVGYNEMHKDRLLKTKIYRESFLNRVLNKFRIGLKG